jgi:CRP/FNR family cyclic AMP-dependent transcriptional regulator
MSSASSIALFEAEPDLARYLSAEDRAQASQVRLPAVELPAGPVQVPAMLKRGGAFAGLITQGMLLQSLRLGEHAGLRLVGPGDIVSRTEAPTSMLVLDTECRATVPTRVALLGRELLVASRRWPWLIAGLHAQMADQGERLTTQLMICQLPRVDDRLLAMLWLLAESWGQVTPSGTVVPIELTHSALGGLIGARRPTVTLALSELTERGAIVRQADGWLLLQTPRTPVAGPEDTIGVPRPVSPPAPRWTEDAGLRFDQDRRGGEQVHAQTRETVARLRAEHEVRRAEMQERLRYAAAVRERAVATRERLRRERRS